MEVKFMKKLLVLVCLVSVVAVAFVGCTSTYKVRYPSGMIVTSADWDPGITGDIQPRPRSYVVYSKLFVLGTPTTNDIEQMLGEFFTASGEAGATGVTSLKIEQTQTSFLFFPATQVSISGEVIAR
jgi:hypothetical protein